MGRSGRAELDGQFSQVVIVIKPKYTTQDDQNHGVVLGSVVF